GAPPGPPAPAGPGVPLALLGGPLTAADHGLVGAIERAGGCIVLDGTEGGERTRRAPFDRRRLGIDPLGALVEAYFGTIPDVFRRPNDALFAWVRAGVRERKARGVVLLRHVWCDLWHAEVRRFQDQLDVPVLDVDLDGEPAMNRDLVRIQAFLEELRA
ncbi:MAG: 2-hydroxyacyl-CoA dehydratase family protein, partial [Planctomycetota bacterium]